MTIQNTVRTYRQQRKATLREFAESISGTHGTVTYQTIKNWEDGATKPNLYFMIALAYNFEDWRRDFANECLKALDVKVPA